MKKYVFLCFLAISGLLRAQINIVSEEVSSSRLEEARRVTIVPPEDYDKNYKYPMILVLDANNLLEPTASNIRYMMKKGEFPPAIVVGIYNFGKDVLVSEEDLVPTEDSAAFFEYVGMDVIPFVEKKFSTNSFKCIVGSNDSANFLNYYLLKENSLFNAYVCLNPTLNTTVLESLPKQVSQLKTPIFYYLGTTANDDNVKVEKTNKLSKELKEINSEKFIYYAGDFQQMSPAALALGGIPEALNLFFADYRPISMKEYAEKIVVKDENIVGYLENKYKKIEELYNIKKKPLLTDITAIYAAIMKKNDIQSLPILVKFIKDDYKKTALPSFIEGEYNFKAENYKKALKAYQKAFVLEEIDFVTKDLINEKMEALKPLTKSSKKQKKNKKEKEPEVETMQEAPLQEDITTTDDNSTDNPEQKSEN